ncbi:hypothetical protein [Streptomyces rubiginosohelvolus]|uniref:hypothetical protein n=1 Tax=Streptomyces rubiginosohelvolus TaxID=67362 RepID=UPI0038688AE5|nr:hypothetical protein OG475_34500 [Streptomyces rubiginosohelvolus]
MWWWRRSRTASCGPSGAFLVDTVGGPGRGGEDGGAQGVRGDVGDGATGTLSGPFIGDFAFETDYEGDLTMSFSRYTDDNWPETPTLPDGFETCDEGVYLVGASASDGLEYLAAKYAAAVRAITGT